MHSPIGGRFPRLLAVASLAAFGVPTSGAQTSPSTPWVGRWVAEARGIDVVLWVELSEENGLLIGDVMDEDERADPIPVESAVQDENRLTLTLAEVDGEASGTVVLERLPDENALRVVRASLPGRRVGRVTLTPRDDVWPLARSYLLDMAGDAEGEAHSASDLRRFMELTTAVSEGLRAGGRATTPLSDAEAGCVLDIVVDAYGRGMAAERARALGTAVAMAAGSRALCSVRLDTITVSGLDLPGAVCHRALVADAEGRTSLRQQARATSPVVRVLPNGVGVDIVRRQGAWLMAAESPPGWLHRSNVQCIR